MSPRWLPQGVASERAPNWVQAPPPDVGGGVSVGKAGAGCPSMLGGGAVSARAPRPQPSGSRRGPVSTFLAKAHSWDLRRMLLRRRASVALFLTVFSFTDWICSARHWSVGGGGAGQWDVGQGPWPGFPGGAELGHEPAASKPMHLPACMGARFSVQRCSPGQRSGQCCWVVGWMGQWKPGGAGLPSLPDAPVPSGFGPTILTNLSEAPSFSSPSPWQTLPIHSPSSAFG